MAKEYLGKFGAVLVLMVVAFVFIYLWKYKSVFKYLKCLYTCDCIN